MTNIPISKLEAARRQLDCAIRLLFENEDSLAVHTLGYAAFRVLYDLCNKKDGNDFTEKWDTALRPYGWHVLTEVPNFLKHADNDPDATLRAHASESPTPTIGMACMMYRRLTGEMTPEMAGFHMWMRVLHPDHFSLPKDEDADFEAGYRQSVAQLKAQPWEARLMLGKATVEYCRRNPDLCAPATPRAD